MPAPILVNEAERLAHLHALMVLDGAPEAVFDSLAALASQVCGTPIALLSLIDSDRQWFKANFGLPGVSETAREHAFCAHAIAADALFEVPDARQDPRFAGNPLVTGAPDIRFYAGAPLVLPDGARVGTLCVIDRQTRQLDAQQAATLSALAAIASQALVMRRNLISRSLAVRSDYEQALADSESRYRGIVEEQSELVSLAQSDGTLVYVNPAYARHFGRTPEQMTGDNLYQHVEPSERAAVSGLIDAVLGDGVARGGENRMVVGNRGNSGDGGEGGERWVAWTNRRQYDSQGRPLLHSVGRDITERRVAERALQASQSLLIRTGRVAGVGGWQLDLGNGELIWSEEMRRIHEVGPGYLPTLETALDFYTPEARPLIEAAVKSAVAGGAPWDLELPFVTATGRSIWVRAQGEAEFEDGHTVRLVGAFQDVSERKRLEQDLRLLTEIIENTTDFVVGADWRGNIQYMNLAARRAVGLAADAPLEGLNVATLNTEATNRLFTEVIVPAVKAQGFWIGETTVYGAGRREMPVSHMVIAHRDAGGRVARYSAVMRDISAEVHAKQQLLLQTATLRSVIEALPAIVAVVGADRRYRFVNSAFERWIGARRDSITGRHLQEVLGPADYERSSPWVERALAGESVQFEHDYPGRGGARFLAISYIPLWLDDGTVDGFIGVAQDITSHRQEEVRLLQLSQRDALTGLLNRAGFEQELERRVQSSEGATLALLYIDLDHFKPVNDRHGHPVGDQVLQLFAQRLASLVRPTDAVARLGGDEFAVLLVGVRLAVHAETVAAKVVAAASAPFEVGTLSLTVGASVGVAFAVDPALGWRDLIARADALLYRAKEAGRGQHASAPNHQVA